MLCIWWDQRGKYITSSQTITAELYKEQLERLNDALATRRAECTHRDEKIILQHDNARPT